MHNPLDPALNRAIEAINIAHAADPKGKEQAYCASVSKWVAQLTPAPSEALQLAACCQHFERWSIPRSSYPMDKPGYLRWRKDLAHRQGERIHEILTAAGCEEELIERVSLLVAKKIPRSDTEAQTLEDAACLVFLDEQLDDFATKNSEKMLAIAQKTWAKMSDTAHTLALKLPYSEQAQALLKKALAP